MSDDKSRLISQRLPVARRSVHLKHVSVPLKCTGKQVIYRDVLAQKNKCCLSVNGNPEWAHYNQLCSGINQK